MTIPNPIARAAKAISGGIVAGLSYLIGVVAVDARLGEAFAQMTAVQWFGLALSIFGTYGIVYRIPNRTA